VDIETDVEDGCILKSMYLGNAATAFQVIRLTEASLIVSTPKSIEPRLIRSIRPTRAGRPEQIICPPSPNGMDEQTAFGPDRLVRPWPITHGGEPIGASSSEPGTRGIAHFWAAR
jgi:hypothetical protein